MEVGSKVLNERVGERIVVAMSRERKAKKHMNNPERLGVQTLTSMSVWDAGKGQSETTAGARGLVLRS